jgi:nucleotide-binding universal stress UspA family protein
MIKRILLTLDGSVMAEQALPAAINYANCFQSELFLLRVINPLTKAYPSGKTPLSAFEFAEEQLAIIANEYLEKIAADYKEESFPIKVATRIGVPYQEIIKFAQENNIDLIVMCTRGQSGFTRWLVGSITDHVIRGSEIPVLVIPAIGKKKG